MVFKTNKKQGNSKYKRKSKLIITILLFALMWCVRDWNEVVVTIDEKIAYLVVIPILVFLVFSQIINTWLNIIATKKSVVLWDRSYGIRFINRKKILCVDIVDAFSDTKKQLKFWGYKSSDIPDVLITMSDGSVFVVRCQTPEKLYRALKD